ncbi:MAG TPA: nucleoside 2-deoxyribosyltransferase [Opitutaceae bacterium]|nr:nucleoside 2-deoxyribosyltransferase [Opitutaceae bacterium]
MKKSKRTYTVYLAGELFSLKHLIGNGWLAEAIYEKSHGKFRCMLPQDFNELRGRSARTIRDYNLRALVASDLALFNFDGPDLDSGTVVEFMFAKCADLPAVLLRSDIRSAGDYRREPWNLMANFFPRTLTVIAPSLFDYRAALTHRRRRLDHALHLAGQHSSAAAQIVCERIAAQCVRALDRLLVAAPVMPKYLRQEVYQWLALLPGFRGKSKALRKEFERHLEQKVERDLL